MLRFEGEELQKLEWLVNHPHCPVASATLIPTQNSHQSSVKLNCGGCYTLTFGVICVICGVILLLFIMEIK